MEIDQDLKQQILVLIYMFLESFKIFMACLLVIFVPQKCNDHTCSLTDKFFDHNILNMIAIGLNTVSLLLFIWGYIIELWREYLLIKYLDVNDNISETIITEVIVLYPKIRKKIDNRS